MMVCFEYISFRPLPSSEMAEESWGVYRSADALRPIIDIGGDWSTIAGSPWVKESGETDGATPRFAGFTMGERKVLLYGVLKLEAGSGVLSGPCDA